MDRVVALLEKIPEVEGTLPTNRVNSSQVTRESQLQAIASAVTAALKTNLFALLEIYKSTNFKSHPKASHLAELTSEWKVKTDQVTEIREKLKRSPSESLTALTFAQMRQDIRSVGRQILDGRRVPGGSRIELCRCAGCSAMFGSEAHICPGCGQEISHPS